MDLKRSYEVSIWTLQDEFITVLKPCNVENLGRLENKELELNADDGINKYSFSIPMYIYEGTERIENPIWYNTLNGNIIANMRKIKVIINKKTAVEAVYEFMIIKVEERHEKDQLYCDVTCEDLAYNELGKIGYKLELSQELYEQEDYEWSQSDMAENEPINNLQYWNSHQLHLYSINKNGQIINDNGEVCDEQLQANKWYYIVQMDWTAYANGANRDTEKVYEEEYTTSWAESGNKLIANGTEPYKEKTREIDAKESNIFNLTQTIAEKFGIFVRYEYLYDSNYHITGRRIIYYNNFMRENDGYLDITYPYNTSDIKREIDGADITTKMYVRPVDSDVSDSGVFSIIDAAPNKSKEDYILNFEYMYQIGAISAEQYAEIGAYELKMRRLNIQHENVSTTIDGLTTEIKDLEALKTSLDNQIQKDQEGIDEAEDKLNAIKIKYGDGDSVSIDQNRPDTAILKPQSESNYYYIDITREGVVRETLHLYKDYYSTNENKLTNELQGVFVEDENGNLIRVKDIYSTELDLNKTIFLTYDYRPTLKTECVKKEYTAKLTSDENRLNEVKEELTSKNNILTNLCQDKTDIENEQQSARKQFEEMMGPALRESYWQPEDYKTTGEKYIDALTTSDTPGASGYTTLIWDKELFEGEQDTKYQYGIDQQDIYYPCVELDSTALNLIRTAENGGKTVSFVFYDIVEDNPSLYTVKNLRLFPIGDDATQSRARYGYGKKSDGDITPILILTGAKNASETMIKNLITTRTVEKDGEEVVVSPLLAVIEPNEDYPLESNEPLIITSSCQVNWFNKGLDQNNKTVWETVYMYYPRIKINSMALNDSNTVLHYNNNLLEQYKDYYIFFRTENISNDQSNPEYETYKYITIKPKPYILKSADNLNITLYFSLYNINTAIYLDALQVMKENSMPKVSYTVEPNFINNRLYYALYRNLNRIVNINDKDLKLVNVQGYISKITLDLDNPFNDKIDIKNYKSKFEDLFTTIVAQTEAMKKNGYVVGLASAAFTPTGVLAPETIQQSINRADLQYSFNQGNLTIDEENGIWATSDDGVVAMRGGGIFTATRKDDEGNWLWNTGILPNGINASLITTGQLDTNLIRIYAGDKLRLQMNGDGYFAYKSLFDDPETLRLVEIEAAKDDAPEEIKNIRENGQLDLKQYVVHNENGLFLRAENGAVIRYDTDKIKLLNINNANGVDRVEVSWDGLKLRNWDNKEVFYADPDTGNLTLRGKIEATELEIHTADSSEPWVSIDDYISEHSSAGGGAITYYQSNKPTTYSKGDIWYNTNTNDTYMASANSAAGQDYWVLINKKIVTTSLTVNDSGIQILSGQNATLAVAGTLTLNGGGNVNIGSGGNVNVASGGSINVASTGNFTINSENFNIDSNGNVAVTGAITATSIALGPEASARDNFNNLVQNTVGYESLKNTATAIAQEVEQNRPILNTMTFTPTDGLVIRASEDSPYSTATKNDGYYIRYNNTEVAKFTGNVTQLSSLAIGDIIVKRSNRGGWMWVDNE